MPLPDGVAEGQGSYDELVRMGWATKDNIIEVGGGQVQLLIEQSYVVLL